MSIHVKEYGDKSASLMVFIHGGGVSGWMREKQISHFQSFHCVVSDLPGHGENNDSIAFSISGSAEQITLYISESHFETYYKESCWMSAGTLYRILKENMSFKLPARFSEASADILVTVGEKERGILKTSAREIGNKNANCRSVMIPGTGHGAPLAQPELFNEMVEKWFFRGDIPKEWSIK
ncbi:alpha/beta fold hydrolase [Bacillus atrophaeus]|uniref:alpha/beta fold hydrolase n=1 Tax=Bacillus atrophaeus TaxID=1452 RepID=UPI000B456144|nr:alpha/beta hydrolase [Bacillus atrophaeus]ARW07822.1 hypothetical protein S101359_02818 [Bacillus atrophaeus]